MIVAALSLRIVDPGRCGIHRQTGNRIGLERRDHHRKRVADGDRECAREGLADPDRVGTHVERLLNREITCGDEVVEPNGLRRDPRLEPDGRRRSRSGEKPRIATVADLDRDPRDLEDARSLGVHGVATVLSGPRHGPLPLREVRAAIDEDGDRVVDVEFRERRGAREEGGDEDLNPDRERLADRDDRAW